MCVCTTCTVIGCCMCTTCSSCIFVLKTASLTYVSGFYFHKCTVIEMVQKCLSFYSLPSFYILDLGFGHQIRCCGFFPSSNQMLSICICIRCYSFSSTNNKIFATTLSMSNLIDVVANVNNKQTMKLSTDKITVLIFNHLRL